MNTTIDTHIPGDESKQVGFPRPAARATVITCPVPEISRPSDSRPAQTLGSLLWKGKFRVLAVGLLGILAGFGASQWMKPVYRAHASLLVEGFNEQALGAVTPVSPLPASPGDYLQNQVKVLESDTLARRVAAQVGPALFGEPGAHPTDFQLLQKVEKAITVRTGMQSQVIDLFFDAPNSALAARGVNAVTAEFLAMNQQARWQLVQDTTEWLNKQATDLKAKLGGLNRELQTFTAQKGLILPGPQGTPVEDRARQLEEALTRAEADRAAKQARYEAATADRGDVTPEPGAQSPLQQYQTDLQNMRRQVADLRTIYQPDNYRVARVEAQIATTQAAIQSERAAIRDRMRNDYLAAASLERTLSASLNNELGKVQEQTQQQLRYNALKNDLDATQKLYDSVMQRAKEAGAESSLRVTNIRVIDAAAPPARPYSPNLPFNLAIGLGLGLLAGSGMVVMGTVSSKIRRPGELTALSLPELGSVPSASRELAQARAGAASDGDGSKIGSSLLWESFQSVLTSILFRTEAAERNGSGPVDGRILVVSSIAMMEGKTTIVSNLGIASAQHGREVLLIDADFRRPKLHERFGVSNEAGLADILLRAGEGIEPESLAQQTDVPHLSVMTAGQTDAVISGLLSSSQLGKALERLSRRFDLIFIDTPPLQMYPDARILGRASDGMVLVVRANINTREELQAGYQKLVEDRIPVLGTILNDWKLGRSQARAYSRYYGRYRRAAQA